jgi:hypothetical protein
MKPAHIIHQVGAEWKRWHQNSLASGFGARFERVPSECSRALLPISHAEVPSSSSTFPIKPEPFRSKRNPTQNMVSTARGPELNQVSVSDEVGPDQQNRATISGKEPLDATISGKEPLNVAKERVRRRISQLTTHCGKFTCQDIGRSALVGRNVESSQAP